MSPRTVYLLRGLPGSGKSTRAQDLRIEAITRGYSVRTHSTDYYWWTPGAPGLYAFDRDRLDAAHRWCLTSFGRTLVAGTEVVIVDNCNVRFDQMAPYLALAAEHEYHAEILEPTSDQWVWFRESVRMGDVDAEYWGGEFARHTKHDVPAPTIARFIESWEELPELACA